MAKRSSFVEYVLEALAPLGPVQARAMFGGWGLSLDGASIGLVDEDVLFLRTDEQTREAFQLAGSAPFTYGARGEERVMKSYWALPADAVDDAEALGRWAQLAVEAARRSEAAKQAKRAASTGKPSMARKAPPARKTSAAKKPAPTRRPSPARRTPR